MAKLQSMRGLQNFISEIRACSGRDAEKDRVDKELGKIRSKFSSTKSLSDYDKKKYIWKLLYIYMLGYPVEFGHKQASDLIAIGKYAEKQVGYMACSILLTENDEFLRLVINSIRNDITCRNEAFQCLALNFVGSVGGSEMASLLLGDVAALLTNGAIRPIVRKKASLALLRLLRKTTDNVEDVLPADQWAHHINTLLEEEPIGVLLGTTALLLGIVSRSFEGFEGAVPRLVKILERMRARDVGPDYTYYGIASPWLQVKTLRVLQYFPSPTGSDARKLTDILKKIITGNEPVKNLNKNNAQQSIVLEAVALALAQDADPELLRAATGLLGKFISMREPNIKYLGLESLMRLSEVPSVKETIDKHQKAIIGALKDADISVRRRALDLLFAMADKSNAAIIVGELLRYLAVADFSMREELVLKTAILTEKFYPDVQWYIDTMITLIERAGEFATEDVWHATVQLVTNHPELHQYAAEQTVEALKRGANHDAMVGVAAAIVGEHGHLLKDVPVEEQFEMLNSLFLGASTEGKSQLLSAFLRLSLREGIDPSIKQRIDSVFERHKTFLDAELQQRAMEYGDLAKKPEVGRRNVLPLPHWDKRKSLLMRRYQEKEGATTDEQSERPAWMNQSEDGAADATATVALDAPPQPEANGKAEEEEAEEEAAAAPSPPPAEEAPLIGIDDDDDYSAPTTGYPQSSNPLDELLGGMSTVSVAPAAATSAAAQPSASAMVPYDPFAPRAPPSFPSNPAAVPTHVSPTASLASGSPSATSAAAATAAAARSFTGSQAGSFAGSAPGSPLSPGALSTGSSASQPYAAAPAAPGNAIVPLMPPQQQPSPLSLASGPQQQRQQLQPPAVLGDIGEWHRRLTVADSGILYEDTYLQVGVKSSFQGASGQVQLYLGNKGDVPLGRLICAVPPNPAFFLQLGPVPPVLQPKQQTMVPLAVTALMPFREGPRLQLGYSLPGGAGGASQSLALPAVVTKFVVPPPQPPPREVFFDRWRALPGPPQKQMERVARDTPLARAPIAAVLAGLRLADLQGFDPQPENFVAAGSFCFAPPGAPPQQVLVLVRIEVDTVTHRQFQVTVASPDPQLAPAVKDVLCMHLARMPAA